MRSKPILPLTLLALALLALMSLATWLVPLPGVRPVAAAQEFNVHRAMARLTHLLGDERPHPADSAANDAVRRRLIASLTEMGLRPQVRDQVACNEQYKSAGVSCARVRNVVATIGPVTGRHLLLSAHYDSTPVGPGAGDAGVGVASLLEIAFLMRGQTLERPVTFLFNEGEELGLIGARAFVESDPIARRVDSLINLEARGVRGPAHMFETSKPNGAAIAAFAKAAPTPVANSLSTDVYRLLPNQTDVNTFEPLGWTTLNLALIGNESRYHSAGDDIAAIDLRSMQHMGDQALALATLLSRGVPEGGGEQIFMDVAGVELLVLPLSVGLIALIILVIGLALLTWRRRAFGRPLVVAVGTIALAGAIGFAGEAIVGFLRPGMFWRADPMWTHLAAYASAVCAALVMLATVGARAETAQLRTAFWFLFVLVGAALATVAPGGIVYFLLPPAIILLASFGRASARRGERFAGFASVLLLYLTVGAMLASLEELLSNGPMWLFAPLGALILLPALIEAKPIVGEAGARRAVALGSALVVGGWGIAGLMPAYSQDRQQRLSIEHVTDVASGQSRWSVINDDAPLPEAMRRIGDWSRASLPYSERKRWFAPAPAIAGLTPPRAELVASEPAGSGRRVQLRLVANGAQSLTLISEKGADIRAAGSGTYVRPIDRGDGKGRTVIRCSGRSCDGLPIELLIGDREPLMLHLVGSSPGLPAGAQALAAARPADARPQYSPDGIVTLSRIRF